MLTESLITYLKGCKERSIDPVIVQNALIQQKWDLATTAEALQYYQTITGAVPQTSVIATPPQATVVNTTPPAKGKLYAKIGIACLSVLLLLGVSTTVMYAYGVIPTTDYALQNKVADVVMTIPFMPKTPRYVLTASAKAHEKVTKLALDASFAMNMGNSPVFGSGEFDAQVTGGIDYTDPEKPLVNMNAKLTKDFDVDVRTKDELTYFRLNSLPSFVTLLLTEFGLPETLQKQLTNKWFYVDNMPLQTDARSELNTTQKQKSSVQESVQNYLDAFNDPQVAKNLSMTTETVDGMKEYHLHFQPTDQTLDTFWQKYTQENASAYPSNEKLSSIIKNLTADTWIDQSQYLVRKSAVTFTIKPPTPAPGSAPEAGVNTFGLLPTQNQSFPVSLVVKFSNFNQPVIVETPPGAVKFDDFITSLMQQAATQNGGLLARETQSANNTKRQSDVNAILNALDQYAADHRGTFPLGITTIPREISSSGVNLCATIVPTYIAALPVDPSLQGQPIQAAACSSTWDTGYMISESTTNQITISAPHAENGTVISVTR